MTIRTMVAAAALGASGVAHSATLLAESFDNVASLSGWAQVNNSSPAGQAYFQGNAGIFSAASGAANAYVAANFLSTSSATGAVSNWLILPTLTLNNGDVLSFLVRAAGDDFLDTLETRLSTAGAGIDVGTTSTSVGTYTTLLGTYSSSVDAGWVTQSYTIAGLSGPTTGRLAFRYVVGNVSTAGNYIGIDNLAVTAVPEPASYALMAVGLAGLLLRRRLAA